LSRSISLVTRTARDNERVSIIIIIIMYVCPRSVRRTRTLHYYAIPNISLKLNTGDPRRRRWSGSLRAARRRSPPRRPSRSTDIQPCNVASPRIRSLIVETRYFIRDKILITMKTSELNKSIFVKHNVISKNETVRYSKRKNVSVLQPRCGLFFVLVILSVETLFRVERVRRSTRVTSRRQHVRRLVVGPVPYSTRFIDFSQQFLLSVTKNGREHCMSNYTRVDESVLDTDKFCTFETLNAVIQAAHTYIIFITFVNTFTTSVVQIRFSNTNQLSLL